MAQQEVNNDGNTGTGNTVLIAMDGSNHAKEAFQFYVNSFHKPEDNVILVCAVDPYGAIYQREWLNAPYSMHHDDIKEMLEKDAEQLKERLQEYATMMESAKVHGKVRSIHTDKIGKGLVDVAVEEKASYVVIGTRGMGTIRRTILGSVSDYVVHHADVPVLIVPPKKQ